MNAVATMEGTTKLGRWGGSRAVRIPKPMCDLLGVDVGATLDAVGGSDEEGPFITLRPLGPHRSYGDAPYQSIESLFRGYEGSKPSPEPDWGDDVGAEVVE